MSGGPSSGTRSARRRVLSETPTPSRPSRPQDPQAPENFDERLQDTHQRAKTVMAFADYAKCEGFTIFSGAESNVYISFGKFRRLLFFFLTSISPEMVVLLDEHAEGPFNVKANVLLFALLDRFTTGAAKCMMSPSHGCDGRRYYMQLVARYMPTDRPQHRGGAFEEACLVPF